VPKCPSLEERLIGLQQRRIDACIHLPADHPLQPPVIEAIQSIPADAEGADDHIGTEFANINVSSPHLTSLTQTTPTTKTSETSIIQNLVDHYSGELPEYETNLEKASNIAFDEVLTESPQQHEPDQEMASSTNTNYVLIPDLVPEQNVPELVVPEQPASELSLPKQIIINQSSATNTILEPKITTNDQPSSSNLSLQTSAPARPKNIPSPPTLFLDSIILANVCENICQELNKLIQARNSLIHEDNYVKQWRRLRERVDFVLSEQQRSSFHAQDAAQKKLQDWLRGIMNDMQEVPVSRILVKTTLCLTGRSVIPNCVHRKEPNVDWLKKINFKSTSTDLELLQRNTVLERENKQLKKELLEQKLLLLEYKTATEAKLEEARIREEKLI